MKKIIILSLLTFFSLFLPATLKPNPETFQLESVNYLAILAANPASLCLISLAIFTVILSHTTSKSYRKLALGFLIGTYLQFILSYLNWDYLGTHFFNVYLYGFWIQFALSLLIFILLYQASQINRTSK
ncbi:hypothetical protein RyT2_22760 [Pseudolactococcus yaeyamensis]